MTDTLQPPPPGLAPPDPVAEGELSASEPEGRTGPILRGGLLIAGLIAIGVFAGPWALVVVGALIVSIFLHELGHFLAAKQAGMKVTEYFLGFGPKIFSFRRGETEYGVKVIPAGAYVRIIGMNDLEAVEPGDEGRTYREKGYLARLRVVLAGPAMNFLIAFLLLFAIAVAYGQQRPDRWTIKEVAAGTAADAAGLQSGDRIVSIAGQATTSFDAMGNVVRDYAGQTVGLVVERHGETITLPATLGWGVGDSAAALLHPLDAGDRIKMIGGQPTTTYAAAQLALSSAPAGTIPVEFVRGDNRYRAEVKTPVSLPDDGARGFLGIKPIIPRQRLGPLAAVVEAGTTVARAPTLVRARRMLRFTP